MLSSVLRSPRAVQVNIAIMRAFVRLREMLLTNADLARKLADLERKYDSQFRAVFDAIRQLMAPPPPDQPPKPKSASTSKKTPSPTAPDGGTVPAIEISNLQSYRHPPSYHPSAVLGGLAKRERPAARRRSAPAAFPAASERLPREASVLRPIAGAAGRGAPAGSGSKPVRRNSERLRPLTPDDPQPSALNPQPGRRPPLLLRHFDRVADAPDAIPRLRQFILDLAVRGKLVHQDPNDEPASELLTRIQQEEPRPLAAGRAKAGSPSRRRERR